jgi:hypothetical protein
MSTEDQGNSELDAHGAAAAFDALLTGSEGGEQQAGGEQSGEETEEQAAERIAAEAANEEAKPDEEQAVEPPKFTIKVDGKDVELTADEMAEAYKGQLRQADYTKKTMEAAEQRKAAEAEVAKARQERETYATKLETFANQANYEVQAIAAQLTEELLQSDPVEYLRLQHIVQRRQVELGQAQQELQKVNDQRNTEKAESERRYLAEQHEQLLAKLPEWKDPAKAKAEVAKIKEYLGQQGFDERESDFTDHRNVILARKAMQFDALMAKAKEATKKVSALPTKVERPGNAESAPKATDGRTAAMKRLSQTGSVSDAAAIFAQFV